jgi:tripartite-type tricarboxylate transporter receptor subunit TctC
MNRISHPLLVAALALTIGLLSDRPAAQSYPERPIHIVVPESGAQSDTMARTLAPLIARRLGQPVVIENRSGAGGTIAAQTVANARPDGYTLLIGGINNVVLASLLRTDLNYAPATDFRPLGGIARVPYGIAVSLRLPVHTLPELIAYARTHPGELTFGSSGTGSSSHLAIELLKSRMGLDMVHVPYRGSVNALPDLTAGRIDILACDLAAQLPLAKAGRIRIVAVTGARRAVAAPQIATVAEQGSAGYEFEPWYGLFAPASIPNEVADALSHALDEALRPDEIRRHFATQGYEPMPISGEELRALVVSETAKYAGAIEAAGLRNHR